MGGVLIESRLHIRLGRRVRHMDTRRLVVICSVASLGILGGGCGSGARSGPSGPSGATGTTAGSARSPGEVASITTNPQPGASRDQCTSGCLPKGALSGGEKAIAQRNKAQFEKFGRAANRTQRVAMLLGLHRYFIAIGRGQYDLACERLATGSASEFQRYPDMRIRDDKACTEVLERIFGAGQGKKTGMAVLRMTRIGTARVDGGRGYVLLGVSGRPGEQVMSMAYTHDRWLPAAPQPYSLAYASPAS